MKKMCLGRKVPMTMDGNKEENVLRWLMTRRRVHWVGEVTSTWDRNEVEERPGWLTMMRRL